MKVKLHRKVKTDLHGIINILYFGGGQKKQKSLGFKMTSFDFDKHFVESLNQFTPSNNFNHKIINKLINDNIDLDVFIVQQPITTNTTPTILEFYDSKVNLITNLNTKSNYITVRKHLYLFLKSIGNEEIFFRDLTFTLLIEFRNYLKNEGREGSTILRYFTILIAILNLSFEDNLHNLNIHTLKKKLNISKIKYAKPLLSISDIKKLLNCTNEYLHFNFVNIALLQLFGNGMRQSDIFLLRYSNFLDNSIVYISLKTKKELQIPYSSEVINILFNLFNLKVPTYKQFPKISNFQDIQLEKIKLETLKDFILVNNSSDLIFNNLFINNSLDNYDVRTDLNKKQFLTFNYLTQKYNKVLKIIKKDLELDLLHLTSHTFRHSYTNLMLESGLDVYDISKSLGHSSLTITQSYIKSSFSTNRQYDNAKRISDLINKK